MKRAILIVLLFSLIAASGLEAQIPDGNGWTKLNKSVKRVTAAWFLYGFDMGYMVGKAGKDGSSTFSYKDADFYWQDVDSFYQTFPLCKKMDLTIMLSHLAEVWRGRSSYKEVANICLDHPIP